MMGKFYRYMFSALVALSVMLLHNGCMERIEEIHLPTDHLSFKATLGVDSSSVVTKGFAGTIDYTEEEWTLSDGFAESTKATLYSSLNGLEAGVYGYVYDGWSANCSPLEYINGTSFTFDGDQMESDTLIRWSVVESTAGSKFKAFVYAPKSDVSPSLETPGTATTLAAGAPVINVENIALLQKDIIVATKDIELDRENNNHRKEIPLEFEHIFTALQFKAGFDCTINEVSISGLKTGGKYVLGEGWKELTQGVYSMPLPEGGLQVAKGKNIGDTLLMIPQILENVQISIKYNSEANPITAGLNNVEWKQGKKITYTLNRKSDVPYIYLDLALGDITISGNKYSGSIKAGGDTLEYSEVTNTYNKPYYIYQSTKTNRDTTGWSGTNATGKIRIPKYDPVKYGGKLWSEYITNNKSVEAVIKAWDNKSGATNNTGIDDSTKYAVRMVGRESTKNKIHITGEIGDCVIVVDNIYSSYQHANVGRTTGGIAFLPSTNGNNRLTINIKGDNRVGCVHYSNTTNNGNRLIFDGEGSLTVADADFNTKSHNSGYEGVVTMGDTTYFSNHWCAAIGNNDSADKVYGLVFKGGVIFAGTTKAENCSAIGGGGNGHSTITIDGGTITAVATTTGTAIGGGIGFNSPGGEGTVVINGGNVYAYNFGNMWKIPSSAIGGAGSKNSTGSKGNVTITGGNVYAESGLGTAIGGGSSYSKTGGEGAVTISGGNVIARSKDPFSAGIGGGSSYTGEYKSGTTKNGGNATITIKGNPIIRTGSIGGGSPGKAVSSGGKIGSAVIKVSGGDIQAQFVMADSPDNKFTMTGGVIRNSATSDNEYYCIQENGAAVYMEKGSFEMSDGTIKECYADKTSDAKGGAVYIKGDDKTSFTMTGGKITECRANNNGGAVYLEGGKVTIEGGTIDENVAYNGNGGAICIVGGSFIMDSTNDKSPAQITHNAAFNKGSGANGNGGGIYVAPASKTSTGTISVDLKKGSITSNSSDRNGGGVCVDMGANTTASLNVTVGTESSGEVTKDVLIVNNEAEFKGGGMYVNGTNANVLLNDGNILNNETSSYQVNPNIVVDGGLVTLKKQGITKQVTITYNNNAQYYTSDAEDVKRTQYVVAGSRSKLDLNAFGQLNEYYNKFNGWNTRRDGKGTDYADGAENILNENITLFAKWTQQ